MFSFVFAMSNQRKNIELGKAGEFFAMVFLKRKGDGAKVHVESRAYVGARVRALLFMKGKTRSTWKHAASKTS